MSMSLSTLSSSSASVAPGYTELPPVSAAGVVPLAEAGRSPALSLPAPAATVPSAAGGYTDLSAVSLPPSTTPVAASLLIASGLNAALLGAGGGGGGGGGSGFGGIGGIGGVGAGGGGNANVTTPMRAWADMLAAQQRAPAATQQPAVAPYANEPTALTPLMPPPPRGSASSPRPMLTLSAVHESMSSSLSSSSSAAGATGSAASQWPLSPTSSPTRSLNSSLVGSNGVPGWLPSLHLSQPLVTTLLADLSIPQHITLLQLLDDMQRRAACGSQASASSSSSSSHGVDLSVGALVDALSHSLASLAHSGHTVVKDWNGEFQALLDQPDSEVRPARNRGPTRVDLIIY